MLDTLRSGAKSWISKLLIGLLVISFAIWGISGDLLNTSGDQVATVGSQKVATADFDAAYRRQLRQLGQRIGRPLSTTEGAALGLPGQVLGGMIAEAALNQAASDLNLGISDEQLVRQIQSSPAFQGPSGGYDRNRLAQVLQANGLTEDDFVADQRKLEERLQIAAAISGGLTTPAPMLEVFNLHANEERTLRYIVLTASPAEAIAAPDDDALAAYFEANKPAFRAPEYRTIDFITMTPESVARPEEVSDADIQQSYEAAGERFGEPERRELLQITFASRDEADAARAALAEGKSFEEIVTDSGKTIEDVTLGALAKSDMLDPAIAEVAFTLQEGAASEIVEGRFAPVLLKVAKIAPAHKTPLAEVADTLRKELAEQAAEREILDLYDEIEDARAGGALLAEVADRFKLKLETSKPFDSAGKAEDGTPAGLPDVASLISEAFESDVGVEADPLQLGRTGFLWFEVKAVTPARDRELDEVRADVVAAWIEAERTKELQARAEAALAAIKGGKSLDEVATESETTVATATGVKRNGAHDTLPAEAVSSAFTGPVGTTGEAAGTDGTRVVFMVEAVSSPAFFREAGEITALDTRLSEALRDSVIGQYAGELQDKLGVTVNQTNIGRVIGQGG